MTSFTLHEPRFTVHEIKGGDPDVRLFVSGKSSGWETRQKSTPP